MDVFEPICLHGWRIPMRISSKIQTFNIDLGLSPPALLSPSITHNNCHWYPCDCSRAFFNSNPLIVPISLVFFILPLLLLRVLLRHIHPPSPTQVAMPPRAHAKPVAGLAGLMASDSEPDLDMFDQSELQAAVRTMSTTKKPRGRPPGTASKVTKTAPRTTRRNSADKLTPVPEVIAQPATTSKINGGTTRGSRKTKQLATDDTVTSEVFGVPASVPATETKMGLRGRQKKMNDDTSILAPESAVKRRGRPPRQPTTPIFEEIPETQAEDAMELEAVPEEDEDGDSVAGTTEPLETWSSYDTSDVALRRRLGELTKKYEALEMRHRDLREVGVREAERNFDRLKKQAEERTAGKSHPGTPLRRALY
jgi:hypothetical protein